MQKTFMSVSFGCRVNEAEKEVLDWELHENGFQWNLSNPQFYIINSCTVTQKAEREVRQHIYQIQKKFPKTIIIVTGCAATKWKKENINFPGIKIIENKEKQTIPQYLNSVMCHCEESSTKQSETDLKIASPAEWDRNDVSLKENNKFLNSGRSIVKIQDGCNRYCSYCIVPYLRGKPYSRLAHEIIGEINSHDERPPVGEASLKEIILTAINTEAFGKDTGETLINLINTVLTKTTIPRISFGSIHPWSITDEFLKYYQTIKDSDRFVHFFHIPIQSGSDKILKLMNRQYTTSEIQQKLFNIKSINPTAFIGTDIITGFPGETEKEFNETYQFFKSAPIDKFHVFRFSSRPGTTADKMKKQWGEVSEEEKKNRAAKLIMLGKQKYQTFLHTMIGKTVPALILEAHTKTHQQALTNNQLPITIKITKSLPSIIVKVIITGVSAGTLNGVVV